MKIFVVFAMTMVFFSSSTGCSNTQRFVIGSAIGGEVGALIKRTGDGDNNMDKQAREMRADLEDAKIERLGEGIKITLDSDNLCDADEVTLRLEGRTRLEKIALILNKYTNTNILIEGHTDTTGLDELNMEISTKRAASVANYFATCNVDASRLTVKGYGESQPIATNETENGRRQNRRIELFITATTSSRR